LIVIFQPHRYSRFCALWKEFKESLLGADYVIVTDVYAASETPIEGISAEQFTEELKKISKIPVIYLKKERIIEQVQKLMEPHDLVMTMGAGDIRQIGIELAQNLIETASSKKA
jgi:UDP-N-acetylmuramate--alanine ligase